MEKYEVLYYCHIDCELKSFFCLAESDKDAEQLFAIAHPEDYKLETIDKIRKYENPCFHTKEEILGNRGVIHE